MPESEWMVIGRVAGAFGVRGEMKVEPLTDFPERFGELLQVFLGPEHLPYTVEGARMNKAQVLLRLSGIETPEQVAKLHNEEITIPRSEAVELPEGHYYLEDLIGANVVTTEGRELGPITDILRTGSNDVYVIGSGRNEILIPVIQDAIAELDVPGRRVVVEPWTVQAEE